MEPDIKNIHSAATAYARAADDYVRGRPGYPAALAGWLRDSLGIHEDTTVLDLGAGTGKFTALLARTGARVVAVEPVREMRDRLSETLPGVDARAGSAQAIPLPDASVDAVTCAQSFHWFATQEALAEIDRVLKPDGRLGLIWNVRADRIAWVAALDQIVNRAEGEAPRYRSGKWREAFSSDRFGPLHEQRFSHAHRGRPQDVILGRALSTSFIAGLDPAARQKISEDIMQLMASVPELNGTQEVTVPYETAAYYTVKQR